ncbi:hypothetical protein [Victivallis vadensis]|uniref:Uncharacterized protein n=1 Tax=Victivallis vadensis TaxID=172901 RepID=A0A2U1AJS9_9BACT|nr:hypothetical protein [Victivallis vadensis]PVY36571.1 hypothetical protein C8D82_13537 [Victivallis vadensis]
MFRIAYCICFFTGVLLLGDDILNSRLQEELDRKFEQLEREEQVFRQKKTSLCEILKTRWLSSEFRDGVEKEYFPPFEQAVAILLTPGVLEVPDSFQQISLIAPAYYEFYTYNHNRIPLDASQAFSCLLTQNYKELETFQNAPLRPELLDLLLGSAAVGSNLPAFQRLWEKSFQQAPQKTIFLTFWFSYSLDNLGRLEFWNNFFSQLQQRPDIILSLDERLMVQLLIKICNLNLRTKPFQAKAFILNIENNKIFSYLYYELRGFDLLIHKDDNITSVSVRRSRKQDNLPLQVFLNGNKINIKLVKNNTK